jgi:hypothetical protein
LNHGVYEQVLLSGKDLDDAIRAYNGQAAIRPENIINPTQLKSCPRCHKENSAVSSFCMQCGMVLTLEAAMDVQERTVQADNFTTKVLTELMKQVPDVLSRIIAEKGGIERINKISNDN